MRSYLRLFMSGALVLLLAGVTMAGLTSGTITVKVNGKQLNQAIDCDSQAGKIGLQSEGGEIHFRTVRLTPLGK